MRKKLTLRDGRTGSAIAVRVIPRAGSNSIAGVQSDGTIRVRLAAAPVDDRANQALVSYLAEVLNISKSRIEIVAGESSRDKLVSLLDLDAATAQRRILAHVS